MQFDLFPERVTVEHVAPKSLAGSRTRIASMFIVRFERESGFHQVFVDHHGTYCAEHGRECRSVPEVARYSATDGRTAPPTDQRSGRRGRL